MKSESKTNLNSKLSEKEKANRFEAIIHCAELLIVEINQEGIVTLVNKRTCDTLGYKEEEIIGKNWFENFLPERIREEMQSLSNKLLTREIGSSEYYENPVLTKDGREREIYWHSTVIKDDTGKVIAQLSTGEDITEKKLTDNKLRESEEKFRIVSESTNDWIYLRATDKKFLYVSPSCFQITGYSPEEFYSNPNLFEDIIYPDDLERFNHRNSELYDIETQNQFDFRIIHKDGSIQWIGQNCFKVIDENGNQIGVRGSNRLITEQKEIELHAKELSRIVDQSPETIVITNLDAIIEYVNNAFVDITGYTPEEAIGQNPKILASDRNPKELYENLYATITKGNIWRGEFINIRKDGSEYIEKAIIAPIFDDNNKVYKYFAIKEDITEKKSKELKLIESEQNLRLANNSKDKLFSIIAHDLRSPFNALIGFSDLLINNRKELKSTEVDRIIVNMNKSLNNTYQLLENLLMWSRTQTNSIAFNPDSIILEKIILDVNEQFKEVANLKGVKIKFDLKGAHLIQADEPMLKTILRNLLSNAIKYTPSSGEVIINIRSMIGMVKVSVKDEGIGMKKERLDALLSDVFVDSEPGTNNEKGNGLGLALCKEFIDMHGGELSIESKEGKGSTFSFTLPS